MQSVHMNAATGKYIPTMLCSWQSADDTIGIRPATAVARSAMLSQKSSRRPGFCQRCPPECRMMFALATIDAEHVRYLMVVSVACDIWTYREGLSLASRHGTRRCLSACPRISSTPCHGFQNGPHECLMHAKDLINDYLNSGVKLIAPLNDYLNR